MLERSVIIKSLEDTAKYYAKWGSPLYEHLTLKTMEDVEAGGPCRTVLEAQTESGAIGLRFLAAIHRLVLEGRIPALVQYHPTVGGNAPRQQCWPEFEEAVRHHVPELQELTTRPLQTHTIDRSVALMAGLGIISAYYKMPLRVLELGSCAGLNLRWMHYSYQDGNRRWGASNSKVVFLNCFGGRSPKIEEPEVIEQCGCDLRPIDPCSTDGQLALMSYVWADQPERMAQLKDALAIAARTPMRIDAADAVEWLSRQLAALTPGVVNVIYHSLFQHYLSPTQRKALEVLKTSTLARIKSSTPIAWLRFEQMSHAATLQLTMWPPGTNYILAQGVPLGLPLQWIGQEMSQ